MAAKPSPIGVVAHFPCDAANGHQHLLMLALRRVGIEAELRPFTSYSNPWRNLAWARHYRLVHWHWLNRYYQGRTALRFLGRSAVFIATTLYLRLRGTRMVMTVHNLIPHDAKHPRLHRLMNRYLGLVMHRLLVHSRAGADAVAASYGARQKIRIVERVDFEGIYGEHAGEDTRGARAVRQLRPPGSRPFVLAFGALRRYKRLDRLMAAADALDSAGFDIVIAGKPSPPEYADELTALAAGKPNVMLRLQFIDNDELAAWLRSCAAVVFCHHEHALNSGAAALAMTHEAPVVCSQATAFQELIGRGLGFACDTDDPASIAAAATRAAGADRDRFRAECATYRDERSLDAVGRKLKAVYEEVMAPGHEAAPALVRA